MLSILLFLAVLSALVVGHEFGHFLAAKAVGMKTEEFGYGFPPRAIGFVKVQGKWRRLKKGDRESYAHTIWSMNWLPLGGFVRLKGEQGERADDPDAFLSKPVWARLVVLLAGVFANWLMAVAIFTVGFTAGIPAQTDIVPAGAQITNQHVLISDVLVNGPAAKAGIVAGDVLVRIEQQDVTTTEQAQTTLRSAADTSATIHVRIERDGAEQDVIVQPELVKEIGKKGIGVALSSIGTIQFPWYRAIGEAMTVTIRFVGMIVVGLWNIVVHLVTGQGMAADVSGPVGIAVMTGKIAQQGVWSLLQFAAMLSLNLAVINVLPIPALDGGRVIFTLLELLRRKRVNQTVELVMHQIGFIALLILVGLVTIRDVQQYGGTILSGVKHLIGM